MIIPRTAVCCAILLLPLSAVHSQDAVINACAAMAEKAFRTYGLYRNDHAVLSAAYADHCRAASSYDSLTNTKKSSFTAVYEQVNRLGYGSERSNASVSETFEAFCKHDWSEFSASQSELHELATIRDDALQVVEFCLSSAQANVVVNYQLPEQPEDSLSVTFSMGGGGSQRLNGVGVRNVRCYHQGNELGPNLSAPLNITSDAFTVSCQRESQPITLYGLNGQHFPRAQITFFVNYSARPFDIFLGEEVAGPLQQRLTVIESSLVPSRAVMAFDGTGECPSGWEEYVDAAGRAIIGVSPEYPARAIGGAATHSLTVEEMPAHNHGGSTGAGGSTMKWEEAAVAGKFGSGNHPFSQREHAHPISSQGGGHAHNNMQPYIALRYCLKL